MSGRGKGRGGGTGGGGKLSEDVARMKISESTSNRGGGGGGPVPRGAPAQLPQQQQQQEEAPAKGALLRPPPRVIPPRTSATTTTATTTTAATISPATTATATGSSRPVWGAKPAPVSAAQVSAAPEANVPPGFEAKAAPVAAAKAAPVTAAKVAPAAAVKAAPVAPAKAVPVAPAKAAPAGPAGPKPTGPVGVTKPASAPSKPGQEEEEEDEGDEGDEGEEEEAAPPQSAQETKVVLSGKNRPIEGGPVPHRQRPAAGKAGAPVRLRANMFPVTMKNLLKRVYQYDVAITPEMKVARVTRALFSEAEKMPGLKDLFCVFDGQKLMWSAKQLPKKELVFEVSEPQDEDDGPPGASAKKGAVVGKGGKGGKGPRIFKITIREVAVVELAGLNEFFLGKLKEVPREALQALDVVMRYNSGKLFHPIRQSFFYPDDPSMSRDLGGGAQLWLGHYQSIRPTQRGLMLNVDIAAAIMVEPIPVLDYLVKRLGLQSANNLTPAMYMKMLRCVKGLKVEVTHRHKRRYRVLGVKKVSADKDTFATPEGATVSVAKYFGQKYAALRFPQLPCLEVGSPSKPIAMPMEVCRLVKGQQQRQELNTIQRTKMIDFTCQDPREREQLILNGVSADQDPFMKSFELSMSARMTEVNGRILAPPTLEFRDEKTQRPGAMQEPRNGQWNLNNVMLHTTFPLEKSEAFIFGSERDIRVLDAERWLGELAQSCTSKGVVFRAVPKVQITPKDPAKVAQLLAALNAPGRKPQLIFCFLSSDREPVYKDIKRICETELGIPSQCLDCGKIRNEKKSGRAYQNNVCVKLNAKLGGINNVVAKKLDVVGDCPTLVMGADVHHPRAGNVTASSIAAIVGSYDPFACKYYTVVQAQDHRVEEITRMEEAARTLLKNFFNSTKRKPDQIVMFRDGVGETHFERILAHELRAIKRACASLEASYNPRVTFIIVQKRNHMRLFTDRGDRSGNLLPGTIVDTDVTHPLDFDYFLCSHAGLKGTSRPTHYHVLYDESNYPADRLQTLTYNLCHLYARCTRTVSIPAPAYYAHLAAYRARLYTGVEDDDDALSVSSTHSDTPLPPVIEALRSRLYYA